MTPPRKKLVLAPTPEALEVWATARGLRRGDVVDVLADPRRTLRHRVIAPGDLVCLEGAIDQPNFAEALRRLPAGVELPAPVSPLEEP